MNRVSAPSVLFINWIQFLVQCYTITVSISRFKLAWSRPPTASSNSLDYSLQVHTLMACRCLSPHLHNNDQQVHMITGSRWISKLARSQPRSSHNHGLQVHLQSPLITPHQCISKLSRLQPPSSQEHVLQLHLRTRQITISEYISKFSHSGPPTVSQNRLHYCLHVHLQTCSITALVPISELPRSWLAGAPQIALKHHLQWVQIYRV